MNTTLHRIVVVGGGAGGLELITRLGHALGRRRLARPILVDSSATHIWKPLLHEVATGALNTGEDELNYFAHAHGHGYEFEYGEMTGLDRSQRLVHIGPIFGAENEVLVRPRTVPFDTLVFAVGAVSNDFGISGVKENCLFLNTPADAEFLRRKVLGQALSVVTGNAGVSQLRIGIVGAGATGVELAAELYHTACELRNLGGNLLPEQVNISVLEGGSRVLPLAPQSLSDYAMEQLKKRGITVHVNSVIKAVTKTGFVLGDGSELPVEIRIWTAGIKAPNWLTKLGLPVSKQNRILVNASLHCPDDPGIFAMGDCSKVPDVTKPGVFIPATAQAANQQALWLTKKLFARVQGNKSYPDFVLQPKGMLVSLGEGRAVGSLASWAGPKRDYYVEGRGAKVLYSSLYRMHQAVLYGWPRAILLWAGDKLRKVALPQLKLH